MLLFVKNAEKSWEKCILISVSKRVKFNQTENQIDIDYFTSWYGVSLICGNYTDDDKIHMNNDGFYSKYS